MDKISFSLGHHRSHVVFCSLDQVMDQDRETALVVTDQTLFAEYGSLFEKKKPVVLPSGEQAKTWESVSELISEGFTRGLARDGQFIGVGGGVITDITGFAASLYMRGIDLVLVPTTLLGMVDAAFGGKTGINYGGYKNMVGTFYPAREIRVCTDFIPSLPEREYRSGLAEVLKSALLDDANLLDLLESRKDKVLSRQASILDELVIRSIGVKGRIVEQDLTEKGIRAHLNLGHTFAHALESVAGFGNWSHGEAVAWGIVKAMELGARLGVTPDDYHHRVRELFVSYGFRLECSEDPESLLQAMLMDKKKQSGRLHFVLQKGLTETLVQEVHPDQVRAIL